MSEKRDRKKDLGQNARKQYRAQKRKAALSILYVVLTYVAVVCMAWLEIMPDKYSVTVGEPAEETINASRDVKDEKATQDAQKAARDAVLEIYAVSEDETQAVTEKFAGYFDNIKKVAQYGYETRFGQENGVGGYIVQYDPVRQKEYAEKELAFIYDSNDMLTDDAMNKSEKIIAILDSNPEDIEKLKNWFNQRLEESLNKGINDNSVEADKKVLMTAVIENTEFKNDEIKKIVTDIIEEENLINSSYDETATNAARELAEKEVEEVWILANNPVVKEGEIVTQEQYDMLSDLGMLEESGFAYGFVVGPVGLVMVLLFIAVCYIWIFDKKIVEQPKKILLLCILILVTILVSLLLKSIDFYGIKWDKMMNAAIGTILIAMLFDEQLALVINTVMSVILALFVTEETSIFTSDAMAIMISSLTGGMAAIYVCKNVRVSSTRAKMLMPGLAAGTVALVTSFAVMWTAGRKPADCGITAVCGFAGGIIAALFSAASLSFWENLFGLLTQSKLLELSNSSSDLLRKMSLEIPGTYQHSTTVAEMAENGAKDIGANPLLAKVCAQYHDIGKLRSPECYTESQTAESKNFHSALSPKESAQMIFSHVTEGVQIAKANKLPREVIDVIKQHHGTSAVMYFYTRAKELDPETRIEDFRYPGPNPQSKVAGIIMLADCIEASVRSMDEKTHDSIKAQIEKMFKVRMDDGELDASELTLKDINVLKQSFLNTLTAVYHTRIKYDNQEGNK